MCIHQIHMTLLYMPAACSCVLMMQTYLLRWDGQEGATPVGREHRIRTGARISYGQDGGARTG